MNTTKQLTKEEFEALPQEEQLTYLIRRTEERCVSLKGTKKTKGIIREAYEEKLDPDYIQTLKEEKNINEKWLKELQAEQKHLRQGMNTPEYYL